MKLIKNVTKGRSWKNLLMILLITAISATTSIQSQTTSDTNNEPAWFDEERLITYRNLNELAKFVDYKKQSKEIIQSYEKELQKKDSIIAAQNSTIDLYKSNVTLLKDQIVSWEDKFASQETITNLNDQYHKLELQKLRRKRFSIGPSITYGVVPGLPTQQGTAIGISLTYAIIRF